MKPVDCSLTLVVPAAIEEDVVDHMLANPQWVSGFSITRVEGAGQSVRLAGSAELVRGRSARVQLQVVMARDDADALVASLRAAFPLPDVAYWITPVLAFGRFA